MNHSDPRYRSDPPPVAVEMPWISFALYVAGVAAILGGALLCGASWPGDPGEGYTWKADAYVPALVWLMSGLGAGLVLFAGASALSFLHATYEYGRYAAFQLHVQSVLMLETKRVMETLQRAPEAEQELPPNGSAPGDGLSAP